MVTVQYGFDIHSHFKLYQHLIFKDRIISQYMDEPHNKTTVGSFLHLLVDICISLSFSFWKYYCFTHSCIDFCLNTIENNFLPNIARNGIAESYG